MARVRIILREPLLGKNYYLVDSNFLVNRCIPELLAPSANDRERLAACISWWAEIDDQLNKRQARVFVPDICIAESFKVLAKKYYVEN